MATKKFALFTDPHVAEIGDDLAFRFKPEVMGDEFLDSYEALKERYGNLHLDSSDLASLSTSDLREAIGAIRDFLTSLMLPDSAEEFAKTRLPNRVVMELLSWAMEIYGGDRPPTSSNGSAPASRPSGTRGTGASRSRASTSTAGR
jgi:hypothetical protein